MGGKNHKRSTPSIRIENKAATAKGIAMEIIIIAKLCFFFLNSH
jgi:hypothetical protein